LIDKVNSHDHPLCN